MNPLGKEICVLRLANDIFMLIFTYTSDFELLYSRKECMLKLS